MVNYSAKFSFGRLICFAALLLFSCNDGAFISPGIRSNMYLKERLRSYNLLSHKYSVKVITLTSGNIEQIKQDINNFTDTKVTQTQFEKMFEVDLKSKVGFLIIVSNSRNMDWESQSSIKDLKINSSIDGCLPIEKIEYPYNFIVFDRLGAGPYQQQIFSYPKYPVEKYQWQLVPTASNVDIWTKETTRSLVFFSDTCLRSGPPPQLKVDLFKKESEKISYFFSF